MKKVTRLLHFYYNRIQDTGGSLAIAGHAQVIWVSRDELKNYDWAEADVSVVMGINS